MEDMPMEDKKTGLSFGFTKKQEVKQLTKSVASDNVEKEDTEPDYVLSLEGKEVKSTKSSVKPAQREYIIPLIKQNKWRVNGKSEKQETLTTDSDSSKSKSLDELAASEILQETARYNEQWEERGKEDTTLAIPLMVQNKVPVGFETDDKLDVTLRPDEPHEADYDEIPIEHFGMAMLRGMGWTETRGIGKNAKVTAPIEAHLRPKGLGLGADRNNAGPDKKTVASDNVDETNDSLILKKNAFCVVTSGVNKDLYGTVEGLDEDNVRVMLKLALSGKVVNIMQCNVHVVSKKEFDKYSKYLNKQKADKYKEDEKKRMDGRTTENGYNKDHDNSESHKHDKKKHKHSDSDSDYEASKHKSKKHKKSKDRKKDEYHTKKDRSGEATQYSKSETCSSPKFNHMGSDGVVGTINMPPWLRNDLRVRIIDKDLKRGKFYKEKVVIVDVPSFGKCVCKTDDGKIIEDVPQSSLETVIPRSDSAYVVIVSGSHRGQIGQVMKKDKDQCLALVQLLTDRGVVLKLMYDDICEFVGNIHHHDDF